jgi:TatD family-associated radical SAM protein
VEEVLRSLEGWDLTKYDEVVFCGYGEPTERLDELLAVARWLKERGVSVRLNTNGLADLIAGEPTAHRLAGLIDTVSISLNTPDAEEYLSLVRPKFGPGSFEAMLNFTRECVQCVPRVVMTVVGEPVTSPEKQERCRMLCADLGATLRVRPYEG